MKDLLLRTRVVVRTLNREFKKPRRQLQRKRQIKIELCVWLSALRLLHVRHVYKRRRSVLSLDWHKWFSCKRERIEDLLLRTRVVVRTSKMKNCCPYLADYVKIFHQKAYHTCSTIIFPHSTNHIIHLGR